MKNIIIFFTGQFRTNPLSNNSNVSNKIIESYNKFLFTHEFKQKYNYKIFISTDDINLDSVINYFGKENICNIHCDNNNWYLKEINNKILPIDIYLDTYKSQDCWKDHLQYSNSINQYYKLLDSYNLYENENLIDCDFILRIRPDIYLKRNILDMFNILENNSNIELVTQWDFISAGRPEIMKYYLNTLNNGYGSFKFNEKLKNIKNIEEIKYPFYNLIFNDFKVIDEYRWAYAPEIQLFECLFRYYNDNTDIINEKIINLLDMMDVVR